MTLREMIATYPEAFYANQTWYNQERFMDAHPRGEDFERWPDLVVSAGWTARYRAVELAALWMDDPTHPMWEHYIWTADRDGTGQRVYVGQNGKGLEIHRHIHLTDRFRVAV